MVPSRVRAATVMLVVRGGLNGNCVVKVEIRLVMPRALTASVLTFGAAADVATTAVRTGAVRARRNAGPSTAGSTRRPGTAGTTTGRPPRMATEASTGACSSFGSAA